MKPFYLAAPLLAVFAFGPPAFAQNIYPSKPVRLIVPFAPGGGLDISTRLIGQKLTEKWGQNVVVDSRPGAATIVGTEIASKAVPDGHTLLMITTTFAINPGLYPKLPYDPGRDFTPVTQLNSQPNIIVVTPSFSGKTVKDLIALAKAKPGELTFATPGAGSAPHLSAEMFQRAAGISMIHVPYKGIPPHIKSGKMRAIAITSAKRQNSMADVPTIGETLPGYRAEAFQGMVAPAGVPRMIVEKLAAEVARIVKLPDVAERFQLDGAEPVGSTPKEFAAFLKAETQKWSKVIKDAGIKPES